MLPQEYHPPVTMNDLERAHLPGYIQRVQEIGSVALWLDHNSPQPEDAEEVVVLEIQKEIRKRLTFNDHGMPWESKYAGNCYSFAWHTSLALEEIGYEHYIAYSNGHAYIMMVGKNRNVYIINTDQPAMNDFEVTRTTISPEILQELANGFVQNAVVTNINTDNLRVKQTEDYALRIRQGKKRYEYQWIQADGPTTAIMKPTIGREALFNHTNFVTAISTKDIQLMQTSLARLVHCNPQQETRERLNEHITAFKKLIKEFVDDGVETQIVLSLVNAFCATMPNTASMGIHRGDLYRMIAAGKNLDPLSKIAFATEAKNSYLASVHHTARAVDEMRSGKIKKCDVLIKDAEQERANQGAYA